MNILNTSFKVLEKYYEKKKRVDQMKFIICEMKLVLKLKFKLTKVVSIFH